MTISITSPLTGASQTGFTSPTYTLTDDIAPSNNGIQYVVSALGGTQPAEVDTHSVSRPFTITVFRPKTFKLLGNPNPVTGVVASVPKNTWKILTRKGSTPLSGQPSKNAMISTIIDVPAGTDTADPDNLRAMLSAHIGALSDISTELGDSLIEGTL